MNKEDIKQDRFQELVTTVVKAYYRQPRNFYIGGAVVAAAVVAIILLTSNKPRPNPQPNILLDEAVLVLQDSQRPDTAAAEQILTELARRYPSNPMGVRANFYLGSIYFSQRKFEEARRAFEKFAAAEKKDPLLPPAALMAAGECYEELGNPAKAGDAYAAAYRRNPKWVLADQAVLAAGRVLRQQGKLKQAEALYSSYLKSHPKAAQDVLNEMKLQLAFVRTLSEGKSPR